MSTSHTTGMSAYPDRSTTLIVVGVLQILLGCFAGLMAVMMLGLTFAPIAKPPQGPAIDTRSMIPGIGLYALAAVGFIWLGIGLVRTRRWAWTLTVVLSWMWLIFGAIAFAGFLLFMGERAWGAVAQQGNAPPEAMAVMRISATVAVACIYLLVPALLLLLCHHESVHATCQRRDPQIPWTDRCPMPVLALSVLFASSVLSMPSMAAYRFVMPLFGSFVSGAAGAVVLVLVTLLMAYLAWGTYRLQMVAWWVMLLLGIVQSVNMAVTFSQADLMKLYEQMGMQAEQLELIRKMGFAEAMSRWGPSLFFLSGAAWLGYLLYVRRYFVRGGQGGTATSADGE